jgi:PPOX class probable F420-dependent enzyme
VLDLNVSKDAHMDRRLRTDLLAWLSTVRADGRPHTVPVWFLWDGETVLVISQPDNVKIRNLRGNPHVTLAVDDSRGGGDVVVLEGTAELLSEPSSAVAPPDYWRKYGELVARFGWTPESMAADYSQAFRIRPVKFVRM